LKCFLDSPTRRVRLGALAVFVVAIGATVSALGELPFWIRNIDAGTTVEAVFFRMMSLPNGAVAFRRPPQETRPALTDLIKTQPRNADLYSLRALEDEQALDFSAAESDWKAYVENSSDKISAQLALADFYHRRLRPADEIRTLAPVAGAPAIAAEKLTSLHNSAPGRRLSASSESFRLRDYPKTFPSPTTAPGSPAIPTNNRSTRDFCNFLLRRKNIPPPGNSSPTTASIFPVTGFSQ
jgi:hypothetical protein